MLERLGALAGSRPRRVIAVAFVFFCIAGVIGGGVFDVLKPFGFTDPSSESTVADARYEQATGEESTPGVIALVHPGFRIATARGNELIGRVESTLRSDPEVSRTFGPNDSSRSSGPSPLISRDGRSAYVAAYLVHDADEAYDPSELEDKLEGIPGVSVGGTEVASDQISTQVETDLRQAELLAFPFLFLLSFVVFRSLVAALLPPLIGGFSIVTTLLLLRLVAETTDISIFAVNLITGLGLGLAIDYSLFMVSRYREELERSGPGQEAISATMRTAGRTVIFSSLTVAAATAALIVFPQRFLYSMGLGGAIVALAAMAVSLTVLPAILVLLGNRVNALAPARFRRANRADARSERGRWYRFSRWVMSHPGRISVITIVGLLLAGTPFLRAEFTSADAQILPSDLSARQVDDVLRSDFGPYTTTPIVVQVESDGAPPSSLRDEIDGLGGVEQATRPRRVAHGLWRINVTEGIDPHSPETQDLVRGIRRVGDAGTFGTVSVTGFTASLVDEKASLSSHLPLALILIAIATLVLLFVMTGSVILPLKALLMNVLTVSAAFGFLVVVFQEGRFEGLLGYTSQGALDSSQPILLFAMIFGLSTDYGVFLLTRIKEARDSGLGDTDAVATGLERTGRIVTFAALLFCIAIGAFVTSKVIFIKEVGAGVAFGVIVDATVVRALLVPSLMAMLGKWNWWAPAPLRRLHERFGLNEAKTA